MALPEVYEGYYNDLSSRLMQDIGTVDYQPQSIGTLKSELQKIIRPSYDKSIQTRQQNTRSNRAAIDADAAARGIGSSTWVTDAKQRQLNNEARDIANINSDYNAALYSALMSRLADQDQLSMAAQQANMNARGNVMGQVLPLAQYFYERDPGTGGGGGGGGGGSYNGNRNPGPTSDDFGNDTNKTTEKIAGKAIYATKNTTMQGPTQPAKNTGFLSKVNNTVSKKDTLTTKK